MLIIQAGSYYIITNFYLIWLEASYIPLHSDDIIVITLDIGSSSISCNNIDIIIVLGYN